jgi:hypothetical protein
VRFEYVGVLSQLDATAFDESDENLVRAVAAEIVVVALLIHRPFVGRPAGRIRKSPTECSPYTCEILAGQTSLLGKLFDGNPIRMGIYDCPPNLALLPR